MKILDEILSMMHDGYCLAEIIENGRYEKYICALLKEESYRKENKLIVKNEDRTPWISFIPKYSNQVCRDVGVRKWQLNIYEKLARCENFYEDFESKESYEAKALPSEYQQITFDDLKGVIL